MTPSTKLSSSMPLEPIAGLLARIALAAPQVHGALTLWPLVLNDDAPALESPDYVPLARALETGSLLVDEISEGGSVPNVRVTNRGPHDVLFLFGEEIRGAKQNRIANASFLVPADSELVIDVSCVERGRWGRRARGGFGAPGEVVSQRMRQKMAHRVSEARRGGKRFEADQGEVWQEVDARLAQSRTASATESYEDYVRARQQALREFVAAFRPLARQVGFVAAMHGEIAGLEVIGRPEVFAEGFEGLLRSFAIDAIDAAPDRERSRPRHATPDAFLAALGRAPAESGPSLGLGEDWRIEGNGVAGCALVAGQVVHLAAFPSEAAGVLHAE